MTGLLLGGAAGVGLGATYFAGLWLTVRRLAESPRPTALVLGSLAARLALAGAVFYWAATRGALPALAALGGFLVVRRAAVRLVRGAAAGPDPRPPATAAGREGG